MAYIKGCSVDDLILYQIVHWAMLGLVDIVASTPKVKLYSFLDELLDTNEINGEPGWFVEKINLNNPCEYMDIKDSSIMEKILKLKEVGELTCFWVNDPLATPEDEIFSVNRFWQVLKDAINDFVVTNPECYLGYIELKAKYGFIFN